MNGSVHGSCQGQPVGRCSFSCLAEDAMRAGTMISLRRMVAVVALASDGPATFAAARVRLNAMTARTSQAAETAPAHRLALARPVDRTVHPDLRTAPNRDSLTTCRQRHNQGPQEHPDSEAGESATPTNPTGHQISRALLPRVHRWIEARRPPFRGRTMTGRTSAWFCSLGRSAYELASAAQSRRRPRLRSSGP